MPVSPKEFAPPMRIEGLVDQAGRRWVKVARGSAEAVVLLGELSGAPRETFKRLAEHGVHLLTDRSRRGLLQQVENLRQWTAARVFDRTGWDGQTFVLPDGPVGSGDEEVAFSVLTSAAQARRTAGSLKSWKKAVAAPLIGQPLGVFVVSLAFAPALLEFFPQVENQGFELVGRAGSGKTTLLMTAASVSYGSPNSSIGGCESWRVTDAGLELLLLGHRHYLLVLDEANAIRGETPKQRGQALAQAVFTLSQGRSRVRYTTGPAAEAARLLFLSSSNTPLADLMDRADAGRYEAVASRLITLPVGDGGIFERTPTGYASDREAAEGLKKAATTNYGTAFRAFVARLVEARREDEGALKNKLERMFAKYLAGLAPEASGPEARVVNAFALVAVAGLLAKRWGILPKRWKITASTRSVYRAHRAWAIETAADDDPLALVERYFERSRDAFVEVTQGPVELTAAEQDACRGYVRTTKSGAVELLFDRPQFERAFGDATHALLERLAACGALRREAGKNPKLSTKHPVKKGRRPTRVYAVLLRAAS